MMGIMGMWWLWIIVIVIVVFLVYTANNSRPGSFGTKNDSPLDLLKKRYAKGEINEQEFEKKKKDLLN